MYDTTTIALFLGSGSTAAVIVTQFVKAFFDKIVIPRFQPLATQGILLVVCLAAAALGIGWGYLPDAITLFLALMFSGGIAIYEVMSAIIIGKK